MFNRFTSAKLAAHLPKIPETDARIWAASARCDGSFRWLTRGGSGGGGERLASAVCELFESEGQVGFCKPTCWRARAASSRSGASGSIGLKISGAKLGSRKLGRARRLPTECAAVRHTINKL